MAVKSVNGFHPTIKVSKKKNAEKKIPRHAQCPVADSSQVNLSGAKYVANSFRHGDSRTGRFDFVTGSSGYSCRISGGQTERGAKRRNRAGDGLCR